MKKTKTIAALVSCSLLGLALSSCANNNDSKTTATDSATPAATAVTTKAPETTKVAENLTIAKPIIANSDASYGMGYNMGKMIAMQPIDIDDAQLLSGFKAAMNGATPRLTTDQMQKVLENAQKQQVNKLKSEVVTNAKASENFMKKVSELNNVVKVNDDVYYQIIKSGTGDTPSVSSTVTIDYKGTTPVPAYQKDNSKFDDVKNMKLIGDTFDSNKDISFPLGNLITCWKDAIPKIKTGSTVIVYCSPDSAYGDRAPASIGPNQVLTFEITLHSFK